MVTALGHQGFFKLNYDSNSKDLRIGHETQAKRRSVCLATRRSWHILVQNL